MVGLLLLDQFSVILDVLARGGGGGSGGGGSGGSGGGGILYLVGLIGYLPLYGLGKLLRKGQYVRDRWRMLQIIGWMIAGIIALGLIIAIPLTKSFALALYVFLPIAAGAVIGMGSGLYSWFSKLRQNQQVTLALRAAEKSDYNWNEKRLQKYAEGIFYKFQKDWSDFNTESMGRYLSGQYQNHINLMLHALNGAHRVNKMTNVKISKSLIISANDDADNNKDTFVIGFTASANDQLIDPRDGSLLFQDKNVFTEYWTFIRRGNDWVVTGIEQSTKDLLKVRGSIEHFAQENGLYYSADWGWLLLPKDDDCKNDPNC